MLYGASVGKNGLKSCVIALSGELSMVMVPDAPFAELLLEDGLEPHAPSPVASRPTATTAVSRRYLRYCLVISAFPV
jgi:hypothetical protein